MGHPVCVVYRINLVFWTMFILYAVCYTHYTIDELIIIRHFLRQQYQHYTLSELLIVRHFLTLYYR